MKHRFLSKKFIRLIKIIFLFFGVLTGSGDGLAVGPSPLLQKQSSKLKPIPASDSLRPPADIETMLGGIWVVEFAQNGPQQIQIDLVSPRECSPTSATILPVLSISNEGGLVEKASGFVSDLGGLPFMYIPGLKWSGDYYNLTVLLNSTGEKYSGSLTNTQSGTKISVTLARIAETKWNRQAADYSFSGPPLLENNEYWYPVSGRRPGAILRHSSLNFPVFCYPLPEGISDVNGSSISFYGLGAFPMVNYISSETATMDYSFSPSDLLESKDTFFSFLNSSQYSVLVFLK